LLTGGIPLSNFNVVLPVNTLGTLGWLLGVILSGTAAGLLLTLLWLIARVLTRRDILAVVLFVAVVGVPSYGQGLKPFEQALMLFANLITAGIILRYGVLAAAAALVAGYVTSVPLTLHLSAWYSKPALLGMAMILAIALYA